MKKRLVIIIIFAIIITILCSCQDISDNYLDLSDTSNISQITETKYEEPTNVNYSVYSEKYTDKTDKDIEINYPQIKGDLKHEVITKINDALKKYALSSLNDFTSLNGINIGIDYEVYLPNNHYLSIGFLRSIWTTRNPNDDIITITLDLLDGKRITLNDIVKIDDAFIETFFQQNPITREGDELSGESAEIVKETLQIYLDNDKLYSCDSNSGDDMHSYLTENSLCITLPASTAMGDYVTYKKELNDIKDFLKIDINKLMNLDM